MIELEPGYIFSTPGSGIAGWASRTLLKPHTSRFHYGLVGDYVPEEDDYTILESITSRGITVGRLSFYPERDLEVYRLKDPELRKRGHDATLALTKYGRAPYDYLLILKLFVGALVCFWRQICKGQLPHAIWYWRLPYAHNSRYLCTEAASEAFELLGIQITPIKGAAPLPAAFQHALDFRILEKVWP